MGEQARKSVILIRHGESQYNYAKKQGCRGDPFIFDCDLSVNGEKQVLELRENFYKFISKEKINIDLIITSPLTRAIKTCLCTFHNHEAYKNVPIMVNPLHVEFLTCSCDVGTRKSVLEKKFPHLSFEHLEEIWWYTDPAVEILHGDYWKAFTIYGYYEPEVNRLKRVEMFIEWIKQRPENTIVVIGHSDFFKQIIGRVLSNCEFFTIMI